MKRFISRAVAVVLTCVLAFGSAVCFAADSTESADAKKYYDYGTYVLLGDSVASGHNDLVYVDSEFKRVENSYGAYVADDLGVNYVPMACPGFRTIDIRYMLEDDYPGDDYLFRDSHNPEVMKSRIPEYRRAISQAGLITLGVGGNDFGTYLTWVIADILEKEGTCSKYVKALRDLLKENGIVNDKLDKIVELAKITDAMPELIRVLPRALKYGLENFFENWNHVIEDIYALNPDVQLLVIGMFDTSVKSDDGATDAEENKDDSQSINLGQMVVDMANKPMKEGAEKYGYIFVDTTGTTCDICHPNAAGYRHIADRILDALPDANFPFTDRKGYMAGTSETQFSPDSALTKAALVQALYSMAGSPEVNTDNLSFADLDSSNPAFKAAVWAVSNGIVKASDGKFEPDSEISVADFGLAMIRFSAKVDFNLKRVVKTVSMSFNLALENKFMIIKRSITRAQAAQKLAGYRYY